MPSTNHPSSAACNDPECDECAPHAHIIGEYDDYGWQAPNEFDY